MTPLSVFLCAAAKDQPLVAQLRAHLGDLIQRGRLNLYSRRTVLPGGHLVKEVEAGLDRSQVALLLLTPNFLSDEDIIAVQLPMVLAREMTERLRVMVVLGRYCLWDKHPNLYNRTIYPSSGKPLTALNGARRDEAIVELTEALLALQPHAYPAAAGATNLSVREFLAEAKSLEQSLSTQNRWVEASKIAAEAGLKLIPHGWKNLTRQVKNAAVGVHGNVTERKKAGLVERFVAGIVERLEGFSLYERGSRRSLPIEQAINLLQTPLEQGGRALTQLQGVRRALQKLQTYEIRASSNAWPPASQARQVGVAYLRADAATAQEIAGFLEQHNFSCTLHERDAHALASDAGVTAVSHGADPLVLVWSESMARFGVLISNWGIALTQAVHQGRPAVLVRTDDAAVPGILTGMTTVLFRPESSSTEPLFDLLTVLIACQP